MRFPWQLEIAEATGTFDWVARFNTERPTRPSTT